MLEIVKPLGTLTPLSWQREVTGQNGASIPPCGLDEARLLICKGRY